MNRIIEKKQLSEDVFQLRVEAPLIARERKAGPVRHPAARHATSASASR